MEESRVMTVALLASQWKLSFSGRPPELDWHDAIVYVYRVYAAPHRVFTREIVNSCCTITLYTSGIFMRANKGLTFGAVR